MFPQRRSIRLRGHDYTSPGAYFVTVCCAGRLSHMGRIEGDSFVPNQVGDIVRHCWQSIPEHFPSVELDEFVVMPNHAHGILLIQGEVGAKHASPLPNRAKGTRPSSLSAVIQSFKSAATREAGRTVKLDGGSLWQRGFFERVIRGDKELRRFRRYIAENPLRWALDEENPSRSP